MKGIYKIVLMASAVLLVATLIVWISDHLAWVGPLLISSLTLGAIGLRGHDFFKGFSFTILIFAAVAASLFYPSAFTDWGSFNLKKTNRSLVANYHVWNGNSDEL